MINLLRKINSEKQNNDEDNSIAEKYCCRVYITVSLKDSPKNRKQKKG